MGRGIAHAFAYAGHDVVLIDVKVRDPVAGEALRGQAIAEIAGSLSGLANAGGFDAREVQPILGRVKVALREEAAQALGSLDVLFEGVPEVVETKRAALEFACAHLKSESIVASTTSTILSTELAHFVTRPQRFLNCHWLNPAYLVPLVELSPHPGTDPDVTIRLRTILEAIGKKPVVCQPAPGYIVPRLQALIMNEAARIVEQGIASAEDVDRAVRYGFGVRYASMGVVEFIDYGGLDILHYASHYLARTLDSARFSPPAIVDRYMQEKRRGLRDGQGFFDWPACDLDAYRKDVVSRQFALLRHLGLAPEPGAALTARDAALQSDR